MTESKYLTYSSCNVCEPLKWKVLGETKHVYHCKNCGKLRRKKLKLIDYKEKEDGK